MMDQFFIAETGIILSLTPFCDSFLDLVKKACLTPMSDEALLLLRLTFPYNEAHSVSHQ